MTAHTSLARIDAATERLYALLPAHVRTEDAARGWQLKALIKLLASGSAAIDAEIDVLYDSMFVETAPQAALADLAALVAADPLRPLPAGHGLSARAYIANTLHYRRGKGTARVLEALGSDVGGYGTVAVEYFQRLARCQHLLDVRPERSGTALPVRGVTASRVGTAFDTLPRLIDVRSIARAGGRHHVPNVGVHIQRPAILAFPVPRADATLDDAALAGVPAARPWPAGANQYAGYFQLAAQPGRALRLFNPDRRVNHEDERMVEPRLRDRLRRLPLHLETQELRDANSEQRPARLGVAPWFEDGLPFVIFLRNTGADHYDRVMPEQVRIANLDALPVTSGARPARMLAYHGFEGAVPKPLDGPPGQPVRCCVDPVTGRLIVAAPAAGAADVQDVRAAFATGLGMEMGAGPHERNADDVPFDITDTDKLKHFVRVVDPAQAPTGLPGDADRIVASLDVALAEWAASGAGKRGIIALARCDREGAAGVAKDITVNAHPGSELHIVSAQWRASRKTASVAFNPDRHGYLVRRERRFTIDAPLRVVASAAPGPDVRAGVLVLDGLELTQGLVLDNHAVSRLRVRHCTLRAPGAAALGTKAALQGMNVVIERSLVGRLNLEDAATPGTGTLAIADSIVSDDGALDLAIDASSLDTTLRNVTILGTSEMKSLEATNVIFWAAATVTRTQSGCVRFSSIAPSSQVPRRFRCQPDLAVAAAQAKKGAPLSGPEDTSARLSVLPLFLDTSLDEPMVAMLHAAVSDGIRLGGENDTEMGAFSSAADGLRRANLESLFDDYTPFGIEACVIDDTRSSLAAQLRTQP
ncbi:hypothetical protein BTH42_32100 [Burkholderia sp. SRS-W-2-2016]|uniref:hypothetical protein n=1 Tax=Burkholderia sp. SRS-W-2-2016 TaxID=1926878 RepID=UPI00094B721D|nr:hypothetical protein [Burkholderia sp. SRS-W-2-2016]OLL27488.1 hypothetical protein BTH42_32100 [Burkholderia sp. SRS-W-2-2016]